MSLKMLENKELLAGKKIIVTGGAGGIGSATVDEFARQGATVYSVDINDEAGEAFVEETNGKGYTGKAIYVHCDIADKEETEKVFKAADEAMGGLNVLIHCAAKMQPMRRPMEFERSDYEFIFDNDMWGTIVADQVACEIMQKYGSGSIVNYSSETALAGEVRTISCITGLVLEVRSLRKDSLVELLRADSAPEQPKGAARLSLGLQTVLAAILLAIVWGSCLFQPTQFMA